MELIKSPVLPDVVPRFMAMRSQHRDHARQAWVGALVMTFSNDELRLLADGYLSHQTAADLRRLGLIGVE